MRIATSTIYAQQTQAIDDQQGLYAELGTQLTSGKKLNAPSDDPSRIAQDLSIRNDIQGTNQQVLNIQSALAELNTTDGALNALVNVVQKARQIAVEGATETLTDDQRGDLAKTIDQLLQQAIATGNTSFGGKFVFGGTAATANPPVTQTGNPITGVTFSGNEQTQGQLIYNGQQFSLSTTFQGAFNYQASNGSPDTFQTLVRLRDTLSNKYDVGQSSAAINKAGQVVYGGTSPAPTTLAQTGSFATVPVPDSSGNFTFTVHGSVNNVPSLQTITVAANAQVDGVGPPGNPSVVQAINAVSASTGVTAVYNARTQRIALTGQGAFWVTDQATAGAATSGNLTKVLNLTQQTDFVQNISTQIGDIDNVLNVALNARSVVGARIQALSSVSDQLQTSVVDNTKVQSGIEDTDVAATVAKFSQTQTALQAAYSTTTRLESKTLFDYLG